MIYKKHILKHPFDSYVDCIVYVEGNNKGTGLPKTAISLVFNLADNFKLYTDSKFIQYIDYKKHWLAGLQTKPTNVESYGTSKMLVIQFKSLGGYIFFDEPLHYFTNNYVTLDNIFKREADEIWEQLQEAKSLDKQFLIIENFLYIRLLANKFPNGKLVESINLIHNSKNIFSIKETCKKLNISRKHLSNLSKEYAGVSLKTLYSLNRLQTTLKTISSSKAEKLTTLAYELEYFDQSHFINDFKKFTNLSPSEYIKQVQAHQSMKIMPHFIPFG